MSTPRLSFLDVRPLETAAADRIEIHAGHPFAIGFTLDQVGEHRIVVTTPTGATRVLTVEARRKKWFGRGALGTYLLRSLSDASIDLGTETLEKFLARCFEEEGMQLGEYAEQRLTALLPEPFSTAENAPLCQAPGESADAFRGRVKQRVLNATAAMLRSRRPSAVTSTNSEAAEPQP